jgi:hypothetical protein
VTLARAGGGMTSSGGLTGEVGNSASEGLFGCGSVLHGQRGAMNSPGWSSGGGGDLTTSLDGGGVALSFSNIGGILRSSSGSGSPSYGGGVAQADSSGGQLGTGRWEAAWRWWRLEQGRRWCKLNNSLMFIDLLFLSLFLFCRRERGRETMGSCERT